MDQIFQIALQYGKGQITQAGIDYALELLGLNKQQGNSKYGINLASGQSINPMNMLKRAGVNQIFNNAGSGIMGPGLLLGGAMMLGRAYNPTRSGSRNYNPALKGQIDYVKGLNGYYQTNSASGLGQYGPGSVLSGQHTMSMFGTNDYEKQLNKKKNYALKKLEKKEDSKYYQNILNRTNKEIANIQDYNVQKTIEKNQFKNLQNINAGNNNPSQGNRDNNVSSPTNSLGHPSRRANGGRIRYSNGGIASL